MSKAIATATRKSRVAIAVAAGLLISILLAVLEAKLHLTILEFLLVPGFIAILWTWGHGGAASEWVSEGAMIGVNAVFYGLAVFVVSWLLGHAKNRFK